MNTSAGSHSSTPGRRSGAVGQSQANQDLARQQKMFEHLRERPLWPDGRIERRMELLRPRQFVALRDQTPLLYLPVGVMEWHERHMPLGTDAFTAHDISLRAAERTGGVVYPALYWGLDEYGTSASGVIRSGMDVPADMPLPGSVFRISHDTYERLLMDAVAEIFRSGIRLVALITGHGARGQEHTIRKVALRYCEAAAYQCVVAHNSWTFGADAVPDGGGHAGRLETALMMGLRPDLVDPSELPPASVPLIGAAESRSHPEHGPLTAETGRAAVDLAATRLAAFVQKALDALPADASPPRSARGL